MAPTLLYGIYAYKMKVPIVAQRNPKEKKIRTKNPLRVRINKEKMKEYTERYGKKVPDTAAKRSYKRSQVRGQRIKVYSSILVYCIVYDDQTTMDL